ncbi:MAG: putative zinc-binding protein [Candidatus Aminicenantes bacterium]|nr:putative zinc-binding protein [Candidatus Aminicenantes bacterium]
MGDNKENVCSAAPTLIFACSGAADVGALSDKAARKLTADGAGKMYCLAGIGGRVPGILKTTQEAEKILAIDGCPLDCTKLSLEETGFTDFEHMIITDLGLEKGNSPATDENIATVVQAALMRLSG